MTEQSNNPGYSLNTPNASYGECRTVHSESMNRDLPFLIFTPDEYETTERPFPVVYLLHGSNSLPTTEAGLRTMNHQGTRLQELADNFKVILAVPITGNSFYLDSPLKQEHKFATFIGSELPTFVDANYRTINDRSGRFLAGFSMGGYGAVSLFCRYPDTFSVSLCRAGVLNLTTFIDDLDWDDVGDNLKSLLGNNFTDPETYHRNGCFNLVNHIRSRKDVAFVIQVGKDDMLYKTNKAFHERLNELQLPHIYSEYPEGHVWSANALRSLLCDLQYFCPTQFPEK